MFSFSPHCWCGHHIKVMMSPIQHCGCSHCETTQELKWTERQWIPNSHLGTYCEHLLTVWNDSCPNYIISSFLILISENSSVDPQLIELIL